MKHFLHMAAGCVLPFLLIFLLPLLGISEGITLLMAMILMFACHLLIMRGRDQDKSHNELPSTKGQHNEHT